MCVCVCALYRCGCFLCRFKFDSCSFIFSPSVLFPSPPRLPLVLTHSFTCSPTTRVLITLLLTQSLIQAISRTHSLTYLRQVHNMLLAQCFVLSHYLSSPIITPSICEHPPSHETERSETKRAAYVYLSQSWLLS